MIHFENVSLRYGSGAAAQTEVLHDLSFRVPEGGFRWLTGPSSKAPISGGRSAGSCRDCAGASASSSRISGCCRI
jgi:energy-coupling factor transporter ATP-binding protein EcfA2